MLPPRTGQTSNPGPGVKHFTVSFFLLLLDPSTPAVQGSTWSAGSQFKNVVRLSRGQQEGLGSDPTETQFCIMTHVLLQGSVRGEGISQTGLVRHRDNALQPLGQLELGWRSYGSPCLPDLPPGAGLSGSSLAGHHRRCPAATQQRGGGATHFLSD